MILKMVYIIAAGTAIKINMKTLILIRHATANNKQTSQTDNERNLSGTGQLEAENIAQQLQQRNCLPDYLLCSPAKRTLQTATILCQIFKLNSSLIKIDNTIYSGDVNDILRRLRCPTMAKQVFVVGHNPNLSWLAHYLCGISKTIILPPAGVIGLEFAIKNWDELSTSGKLLFFIEPKHESN